MVDLPTLKVGCGKHVVVEHNITEILYSAHNCGNTRKVCLDIYCDTCRVIKEKVLPILKAHTRSHQKDFEEFNKEATEITNAGGSVDWTEGYKLQGARDAVLTLAGKTIEELEDA